MSEEKKTILIGVISDTHGLLRPEAVDALGGVDQIFHAGDIGGPEILTELGRLAPVTAVRGNNDKGAWAEDLPQYEAVQVGQVFIYMLHDLKEIGLKPEAAGFQVVISGHSHKPQVDDRRGVLYLNPGSAGPRRFHLPISVAYLKISRAEVAAEIVVLELASRV